jgi:hypothetical protein
MARFIGLALGFGDAFDFGFQRRHGAVPELVEPGAHGAQPLRIDGVDAARPILAVADQAGVLQHLQVLRDRGPADRQARGDLAHRARPGRQPLQHPAAGGIGQGGEGGVVVSHDLP